MELSRPTAILAYTKHMGGVDLADQLASIIQYVLNVGKIIIYNYYWFLFMFV